MPQPTFPLNRNQFTKKKAIAYILRNPVYAPDSGLVRDLAKAMSKLSNNHLNNLALLIQLERETT